MGSFQTKFYHACKSGSVKTLKELRMDFSNQLSLNKPLYDDLTPLALTIKSRNVKAVQELLRYPNIDINKFMYTGETALTIAIATKNMEIIRLLLENGANAHTPSHYSNEKSPLVAVMLNYTSDDNYAEIVGLLMRNGAYRDLNIEFLNLLKLMINNKNSAIYLLIESFV